MLKSSKNESNFISCSISIHGDFLYAITENKKLYCFNLESGKPESELVISEFELFALARHPYSNIVAASDEKGKVSFWKA